MAHGTQVHVRSQAEFEFLKKKRADEMRGQLGTFAIMIFLTLIAFTMVAAGFSVYLVAPVLLLMAAIQVVLQLYYFMHMSGKGHGMVAFFMYSGMFIAFITILAFLTIIWW